MLPVFFDVHLPVVGQVTFPAYMTMLMVGFIVAIVTARRHGERIGLDGDRLFDLGVLMLVLGIAGARLLAVLTDGELMSFVHLCTDPSLVDTHGRVALCSAQTPCDGHFICGPAGRCHPPRDCLAALKFWQGGLTYYGGFLLAVPAGLWYARKKRMPVWTVADVTAPPIMLGLFFGRLGCFFNGCCHGAPTESWVGVKLPRLDAPTHPAQLYEGLGALALFAVLYFAIRPRKRGHGEVFGWLLALYGVMRVVLELFRADQRGALGPLSTSQIISVPLIAAGVYLIARVRGGAGGVTGAAAAAVAAAAAEAGPGAADRGPGAAQEPARDASPASREASPASGRDPGDDVQ